MSNRIEKIMAVADPLDLTREKDPELNNFYSVRRENGNIIYMARSGNEYYSFIVKEKDFKKFKKRKDLSRAMLKYAGNTTTSLDHWDVGFLLNMGYDVQ